MDANILVMGLLIGALFVIPFLFALKYGKFGKTSVRKLVSQDMKHKNLDCKKIEVIGRSAIALLASRPGFYWCETDGTQILTCREFLFDTIVDCRVMVNNLPWSGKPNHNTVVSTVKLRIMFSKGESMQQSLPVFDAHLDDPMEAPQSLESALRWAKLIHPHEVKK